MDFNYYDKQARPIQLKSQNHLSGTDVLTQTYSFVGELLSSIRTHVVGSVTTTIGTYTDYDHVGRKVATRSVINSQPEVMLSKLFYNELGQLKDQKLHSKDNGTSFLYTSSYSYNERGWLKQMSGTEFSFELKYNDATGGMTAQYNGNIANQVYNNNGSNTFNYAYDKLNRLTSGAATGMTEVIDYDVMGNIKHLNRNSGGTALYSYSGNRLNSISGGGLTTGAYGYDGNGNATTDGRTGVTLTYNYLNLPATAIKSGLNLTYTYDAAGNKLRKVNSTTATTTDYVGGIQYTGGVIDFIQTENGIAKDTLGVYRYRYNLTDHLGNVRATIRESVTTPGSLQVMQRDNYYAFGLTQVAGARNNKYLYNSKELQSELGQYDYGARFYDPVIGRWNVVDPLAEKYHTISPYAFVGNNPANAYDSDGRKIIYVNGYFSRMLNLAGIAPGAPKEAYWNFFSSSFISSSRQFMGAASYELNEFVDGSSLIGGDQSGGDRYVLGMQYAMENYSDILKGTKKGETFKFVSHSEGGAFAAGMAAYLTSQGQTVESMLYLSPDEVDEFSSPFGTFSMQSHFQNDPVSPSMRLDGVDVYMNFSSLKGKKVGKMGAHGATVTKDNINKMKDVLGKLGPYASKLLIKDQWTITETKNGYIFKREDEKENNQF